MNIVQTTDKCDEKNTDVQHEHKDDQKQIDKHAKREILENKDKLSKGAVYNFSYEFKK